MVARHHQDQHKSYPWSVRTGAAACRGVSCRRCSSSDSQDLQKRLGNNRQSGIKRELSQQQIQHEENKSRSDGLLPYAENRTPKCVQSRPQFDQVDFISLNVSSRTASSLSAEVPASNRRMLNTSPLENYRTIQGSTTEFTSPGTLREDTTKATSHSSNKVEAHQSLPRQSVPRYPASPTQGAVLLLDFSPTQG